MENKSNNNSKTAFAVILIFIGAIWIIRQLGLYFDFPFHFGDLFYPVKIFFRHFGHILFSWQIILIIIGLILLAGKRTTSGTVLIITGGIFLLPKIFFISGMTASILLPLALIAVGVALVVRII